jgi:hypothetical protein
MAGFLPPAVFEIKAIADGAIAKFKDVNKELDKMGDNADQAGGKVSRLEGASKVATAGVLALGAAFVGFAAYGIKEAVEAEQAMLKLGTTMSNMGVNTEANRKQVEALTSSYIDLGFADEEAAAGFDVLLRATGDVTQAQDLLATSADYARVKGLDLASASAVISKASQGSAKAFKEMGITLDTTIPKADAIKKAMGELNDKIGGQATAYTKTFAGQVAVMKEQFNNTAETLGTALLPILKQVLEKIQDGVKFVQEHSTAFKVLAGVIITVTLALAAYNVTTKAIIAAEKAKIAIMATSKMIMAAVTGQQIALNTAQSLNPIGLIVAAVVLLIGAMIILWNKCEPFRKILIQIGKVGVMAFGFLIEAIGFLVTSLIKVVTGPLKLLLKGLALLGNDSAKKALDGIDKMTDGVSNFFTTASEKVKGVAGKLDALNKPIKIPLDFTGGGIPDTGNNGKGGKGGKGGKATPEEIAAAKKKQEGYMKIVKDMQERVSKATTNFNEDMAKAQKNYDDDMLKAAADFNEAKEQANAAYAETEIKLTEKKNEDLAKLANDNQKKVADITKAGQDKLEQIVQQSIDRLRDAFKKGTEFNVADIFQGLKEAGTQSAQGLLDALKTRLAAAKDLAANAAKLQAQGFSQTFIEQVVAAGPEVGNQLSKSILDAKPETIKELQATYANMETVTNTGMDKVATEMNAGANLATAELRKAYAQAQVDTQDMLTAQAKAFADSQTEIKTQFDKDLADAAKTRDKSIAEAQEAMNKAIAAANKALAEAQAAARKQLSEDLAAISKEFDEKLKGVRDANAATIASINALKAAMAMAATLTVTPVSTAGVTPVTGATSTTGSAVYNPLTGNITYNTNVLAQTNASPTAIAATATAASKLQSTVTLTSSQIIANRRARDGYL